MWKLFGKEEDYDYVIDPAAPADSSAAATPATSVTDTQVGGSAQPTEDLAQQQAPVAPAAPTFDLSAPVIPPVDATVNQPSATPSPVMPDAASVQPVVSTPEVKDPMDALTPSVATPAAPSPADADVHAAQPAALDATPAPAAVPGMDTTQAVMDHQVDMSGVAPVGNPAPVAPTMPMAPVANPVPADVSTLMSPGSSNDGPPVPGVSSAPVAPAPVVSDPSQEIHTADHDLSLVQHVLNKLSADPNLSLQDAVSQAHDEITH